MRCEREMLALITGTAQADDRIRAVIMNGSRANPNAPRDIFQDFDIVYLVSDVAPFRDDPTWVQRFGELMIMQLPDTMDDPPGVGNGWFAFLMQFADGNRIDLGLFPVARINELNRDSLSILLLDKDGVVRPFGAPNESDYLPRPPSAKAFADCCNEFWWVCPYVTKGLWRDELTYARYMLDPVLRDQILRMLAWYVGIKTDFTANPGKLGKYLKRYLEPELWALLEQTYAGTCHESTWHALYAACDLFRLAATRVAEHSGFAYPRGEDERVSAHLRHVQALPKDAREMY